LVKAIECFDIKRFALTDKMIDPKEVADALDFLKKVSSKNNDKLEKTVDTVIKHIQRSKTRIIFYFNKEQFGCLKIMFHNITKLLEFANIYSERLEQQLMSLRQYGYEKISLEASRLKDKALTLINREKSPKTLFDYIKRIHLMQASLAAEIPEIAMVDEMFRRINNMIDVRIKHFRHNHPMAPPLEDFAKFLVQVDVDYYPIVFDPVQNHLKQEICQLIDSYQDVETRLLVQTLRLKCGGEQVIERFDMEKDILNKIMKAKTDKTSLKMTLQYLDDNEQKYDCVRESKFKVDKGKLGKHYTNYSNQYLDLIKTYNENVRGSVEELVKITKNVAAKLKNDKKKDLQVSLLSHVCATWTRWYTESSSKRREMNPLISQVLSMILLLGMGMKEPRQIQTIFRAVGSLLGKRGSEEKNLYNTFIEIETGGGKSIVLGILSTYYALIGCKVYCTCCYKFLSVRDQKAFEGLWTAFGLKWGDSVDADITYSTYIDLMNIVLNERGSIRNSIRSYITEGKIPSFEPESKRSRILLIDEVDVFFAPEFYGSSYNPSVKLTGDEEYALIKYIWKNRSILTQKGNPMEDLKKTAEYKSLYAKYNGNDWVILNAMSRLLLTLPEVDNHMRSVTTHVDEKKDAKIAYIEFGQLSTNKWFGYLTDYAYLIKVEMNEIKEDVAKKMVGIAVSCGRFSYAELFRESFSTILGVSGTLKDLTAYERKIARNEYNVHRMVIQRPLFETSNKDNMPKEVLLLQAQPSEKTESTYQRHCNLINENIKKYSENNGQPVLVFFRSNEEMEKFHKHVFGDEKGGEGYTMVDEVAAAGMTGLDKLVRNSVRQDTKGRGEVTLFSRTFGRGCDFSCASKEVENANGVVVIQTFLSASTAEENQIIGRTCRQGCKGRYCLILNENEVLNELSTVSRESLRAIFDEDDYSGKRRMKQLRIWRDEIVKRKTEKRREEDKKCATHHNDSVQLLNYLHSGKDKELRRILLSLNQPSSAHEIVHYVFCLDQSGSMQGRPWILLIEAFRAFVGKLRVYREKDLVTVITFDGDVTKYPNRPDGVDLSKPVKDIKENDLKIQMRGGGTCFGPPLLMAHQVFKNHASRQMKKILIFMSDGDEYGDSSRLADKLLEFKEDLTVHMIYFGLNGLAGQTDALTKLTKIGSKFKNRGHVHQSLTGVKIKRIFVDDLIPATYTQ